MKKENILQDQDTPGYYRVLKLPAFFPDATYGTIHSVPSFPLHDKLQGMLVTSLHFQLLGLADKLKDFNGFREFAGIPDHWHILTDSGGFQILSLIVRNKLGEIRKDGAFFKNPKNTSETFFLTPENSQQIQHTIGSDMRVVLDIPLYGNESYDEFKNAMEQTTEWAQKAKDEFLRLHNISAQEFKETSPNINFSKKPVEVPHTRPLLFGVVQGGPHQDLQHASAEQLIDIGFDGYGFGGWGKVEPGRLEGFVAKLPKNKIIYGMGLGSPDDIVWFYKFGLMMFDCVIPTRNARHGMLFVTKGQGEKAGDYYDVVRIKAERYSVDKKPIDPECECPVCKSYSRSYVRFLLRKQNPVGFTLASIHNLWWYQTFMERLPELPYKQ